MKNRKLLALLLAALLALTLSACQEIVGAVPGGGDSSLSQQQGEPEATPEPVISELDKKILEREQTVSDGGGTAEDYLALADLYLEAGRIKDQRNILERSYRLFADATAFERLQGIVVNAKEDSKSIFDMAVSLQNNMSIDSYHNEAVGVIGGDWLSVMMPKLKEGRRNYYLEDEQYTFYCEVGYASSGAPYTKAWYTTANNSIVYLSYERGAVRLLTSGYENGQFNGEFTSWLCTSSGAVYNEAGNFGNGVLVGDYTANYSFVNDGSDLFTLFSTKDILEYTSYKGNFGDNGISTVSQPAGDKRSTVSGGDGTSNYIVYAYTEDAKNYLFLNAGEESDAGSYVFDTAFMNTGSLPDFARYTPVASEAPAASTEVDSSKVEFRIVDSNVEWFDGTNWHILGDVEDYIRQDPFYDYNSEAPAENGDGEGEPTDILGRQGLGAVKQEVKKTPAKPKATPKPSGGGGGSAPAPVVTPAPTPEPTPVPPPPPEDIVGGETDIEWSGDVL